MSPRWDLRSVADMWHSYADSFGMRTLQALRTNCQPYYKEPCLVEHSFSATLETVGTLRGRRRRGDSRCVMEGRGPPRSGPSSRLRNVTFSTDETPDGNVEAGIIRHKRSADEALGEGDPQAPLTIPGGESEPSPLPAAIAIAAPTAAPPPPPPGRKSKKGKGGKGGHRDADLLVEGWSPVQLSKSDRASQATLSADRMSVTSRKGYRMVRATHGAHQGCWYYEATMAYLGETGHCRLGWSTRLGELQAPVGFDIHSFAYRDLEGSKVHKGLREEYGQSFHEGDVIGCLLYMPPGGHPLERTKSELLTYKGDPVLLEQPPPQAEPLINSCIAFSLNGKPQGIAYRDIPEGTYCPAASIFTHPDQTAGATLTFNFGPDFAYAPPQLQDIAEARPVSDLASEKLPAPSANDSPQPDSAMHIVAT
ncbi:hypothetical protein WJX74_002181 [Apatococcus lobatus]|uniref:B30.2/SPRY domain-containing protein n=1 Tax=Apatococcus lobatus TaxID=904363 RepID=A0AAW1QXG2_9CHLO